MSIQRMIELKQQINKYNEYYYNRNESLISDEEYDVLMRELEKLEDRFKYLDTTGINISPTQTVGAKPKGNKVKLFKPMLSLADVFSFEELGEFFNKVGQTAGEYEFSVEKKIDGLAAEIIYENGELYSMTTRGDKEEGEDVTDNHVLIVDLPLKIKIKERLVVNGEIYMMNEVFEEYNEFLKNRGLKLMANPRNCAAGTMRQLNPKHIEYRYLNFFAYNIANYEEFGLTNQSEILSLLEDTGFVVDSHKIINNMNELKEFIENIETERKELEFGIDGAVIKLNNLNLRQKVGYTSRSPKWAVAYKFRSEEALTVLEGVDISVGRTGIIAPTAILKPVRIDGTEVARASLYNQDFINEKDIRIGDTVLIHKAGDIIPEIIEVIKSLRTGEEKEITLPETCPSCGHKTYNIDDEVALRCINPLCEAILVENLKNFVSKRAMNIEGLGERLIETLHSKGKIRNFADIYDLTHSDISRLDGYGDTSAGNIIESIENSKTNSLERLICGLGIPKVGERLSKDLAKYFGNIIELIEATEEDLLSIDGVGIKVASEIVEYFYNIEIIEIIERIIERGVNTDYTGNTNINMDNKFYDKTVVITGTFSFSNRNGIKEDLEKLGATVSGSVSKKTNYLLCGESPGSKFDKANELGIEIIYEEQLKEILQK